jgi:anti-sigma regulatory factor (Ser/Thr protein kinase)
VEALASSAEDIEWIRVEEASAAGRVRRVAAGLAQKLGFSEHRAGEIAIGATELATNLTKHAVKGTVLLRVRRTPTDAAVELIVTDSGPGVANLLASARDGESTAGTLGIGLGAAMRMATWFEGHSVVGRGTVIVATFWRGEAPEPMPAVAIITRAMEGEIVCGDSAAFRTDDAGTTTVLLADGLGHGELAARASREAVRALGSAQLAQGPARILKHLNDALRGTRGAAAAVVQLNAVDANVTFAGIGNVAVWIDDGTRRQSLVSTPGIVGSYARTVREVVLPLMAGSLVLLHSDGLTSKWDLAAFPGLRRRNPLLIAATLIRDAGVHRDDASVAVARAS